MKRMRGDRRARRHEGEGSGPVTIAQRRSESAGSHVTGHRRCQGEVTQIAGEDSGSTNEKTRSVAMCGGRDQLAGAAAVANAGTVTDLSEATS